MSILNHKRFKSFYTRKHKKSLHEFQNKSYVELWNKDSSEDQKVTKKTPGQKNNQKKTEHRFVPLDSKHKFMMIKEEEFVEISMVRESLLQWYNLEKRDLPWRKPFQKNWSQDELGQRAYEVWVSEIMLQQTQVATVIPYYEKWMKKWPTIHDLSLASIEEVNEMWAGLGYYSRAKRLLQGAQLTVTKFNGNLPSNCESLIKEIPGVGKYTGGAIASIAYNEITPIVDGNVIRVLSRLRAIHADSKSKPAMDLFWDLASQLVDPERPGDFNQALMDLGATICTPKNASCGKCPLQNACFAFQIETQMKLKKKSELCLVKEEQGQIRDLNKSSKEENYKKEVADMKEEKDIQESGETDLCTICFEIPDIEDVNVHSFPAKTIKKEQKKEDCVTCIVEYRNIDNESSTSISSKKYLLIRNPDTGIHAGLWDFPKIVFTSTKNYANDDSEMDSDADRKDVNKIRRSKKKQDIGLHHHLDHDDFESQMLNMDKLLKSLISPSAHSELSELLEKRKKVGSFVHLFTHIRRTIYVYHLVLEDLDTKQIDATSLSSSFNVANTNNLSKWVTESEMLESTGVPTTLKKAFELLNKQNNSGDSKKDDNLLSMKRKRKPHRLAEIESKTPKSQRTLMSFFSKSG